MTPKCFTRVLAIIAILLMIHDRASAQIKVTLLDEKDEPLIAANTVLLHFNGENTGVGATSDLDGTVLYEQVKPGEYHMLISYLSYLPDTIKNILITGSGYPVDLGVIKLEPASEWLDEVVIEADAVVYKYSPNRKTVNVQESVKSTGETLGDVLNSLPGVGRNSGNELTINGRSGVQLYIDNQLQYADGGDLGGILQSFASENIDKIDVIDVASARYDASGGGGVIKVYTLRAEASGTYGSIWARYRYSRQSSAYSGGNLNWKHKNWSGSLYYAFSLYQGFHEIEINRRVEDLGGEGIPVYFNEKVDEDWIHVSHVPRVSLSYDINDRHRIGVQGDFRHVSIDFPKETYTGVSGDGLAPDSIVLSDINVEDDQVFPSVNVNYRASLKDNSGAFDAAYDFFSFNHDVTSTFNTQKADESGMPVGPPSVFREISDLRHRVHTANVNFSKGLKGDHYIDLGTKVSFIDKDSEIKGQVGSGGTFTDDPNRNRSFTYSEDIYAGYVNWATQIPRNWSLEAGLRVEHTRVSQTAEDLTGIKSSNYTDYFPFAGLYQQMENGNSFALTYARRTKRPNFDELNPFNLVINPFLAVSGNPDLVPQTNNLLDVKFNLKLKT